jgi:ABC-type transport system involved in Fe-S cluster assembly fused permease/ATPase subunit
MITDSLINYETVRYCGGQDHERKRYAEVVRKLQAKKYMRSSASRVHYLNQKWYY